MITALKSVSLTDIVLPTTGPTAGLIDEDTDDKPCDEVAEAEMGESDVTDKDSDEEEMEADNADGAQVRLFSSINRFDPVVSNGYTSARVFRAILV